MDKKIRVLVKEPGKEAELRDIPNTLKALQNAVGGYIETMWLEDSCVIICNEEGKLQGLPPNFLLMGDLIVGTAVLAGVDGEEFCSLTDEQIKSTRTLLRCGYGSELQ